MKLSDLDKVKPLKSKLDMLRRMEIALTGFPPYEPRLVVNGDELKLNVSVALGIVQEHIDKTVDDLKAIGVTDE